MNFTAVDFETCAYYRASACAVGAVQVRDGQIVDSFYSLLKPPKYPYWNFEETHNITQAMVETAPTFPEVWPRLKSLLSAGPFVAHKVDFDWNVLTHTLKYYALPGLELERICTCRLAQRKCPELPRHDLATVAAHFGIALDHHHAASDARACAELAMRLWSE
ncbi:MAG: 3'-5' exonuclease [Phycisphaerae bacterium]|jgi:DNA polymerase-3 subunit epsilon